MAHLADKIKDRISTLKGEYTFFSLPKLEKLGHPVAHLPFSVRILLENAIRNFDGFAITGENIETLLNWKPEAVDKDIPYKPARVLMQDFTGVPAVVDIASLRAEMARKGKNPDKINPLIPVDLVIDHSVQVDYFGTDDSLIKNVELEYSRNKERYQFLKWAQKAFDNFSVVPPGMGICHQVNLEYLAQGVITRDGMIFPDTLVGTDSHTPMVNGIGVIGWGVGGIEAEAAILGQPIYFIMPEVIGLKLSGKMPAGTTATDLVLTITKLLRSYGVVGKFVEVFGDGLDGLTVPDRATISNMSPEFGCTVTYFPVDSQTLEYMKRTNRPQEQIDLVETYCKNNMLWRTGEETTVYSHVLELDLNDVEPVIAGPKRPQDKILLRKASTAFLDHMESDYYRKHIKPGTPDIIRWKGEGGNSQQQSDSEIVPDEIDIDESDQFHGHNSVEIEYLDEKFRLSDGSVVLAAITSCTNTSNPSVMIGAGLVARKARERGVFTKSWVKTSLAPGSKVVTDYLSNSGLLKDLESQRFHLVGYGCTSCIGNSGPLPGHIAKAIDEHELVVASVLSGNRNFEARVHPQIKLNYLMSPLLVVAYAIAGRMDIDLLNEPLDWDADRNPVYLKDLWPSSGEIYEIMSKVLTEKDFENNYSKIFEGDSLWKKMEVPQDKVYQWDSNSTYIKEAPFFDDLDIEPAPPKDIIDSRVLLLLGDSITTDHISPAGAFSTKSPAGKYLLEKGVERKDFNSYGSRRGNDEIMVRGTFANVRIRNRLSVMEGGYTNYLPSGEEMSVYDAAKLYRENNVPLIVIAGKEYGSGSSRDWAAKGTFMLGIKAVIAESYERIHRSNLIGMGVLPLQFMKGDNAGSLGLTGREKFTIKGIADEIRPGKKMEVMAHDETGNIKVFRVEARLDSGIETAYYKNGGILQYVLRQFLVQ
ncbi:MAG: aconitate hydratase AcnA [Bacteroidales bacterium]